MDRFTTSIRSAGNLCGPVIGLALNLAVLFLVVGVVFPSSGGVGIVDNVSNLVGKFTSGGLTGLITLLLFLSLADSRSTA
ncbi:MAG: hypothetical protein QF903_15765 [Planctomycetota bacterium]|jgi:hypothetical protein|nr:hypothetical protein [Planctomycetota bacterium]MDP6763653.1 hypothetical protein [Planctomycetota bacterium]MDP6990926.1 hypothetical protein [Planctomycetota bacterium]